MAIKGKRRKKSGKPTSTTTEPLAPVADRPFDSGPRFFYLGSSETAGVFVDEDRAMRLAAVYACVRVISQSIASLPWHLWKQRPDHRGADIAYDDDLEQILQIRPNPEMTPYTFKELLISHAATWGNGYAEIERDRLGRPVWLWPITPDRVRPDRYPNGQLYYDVTNWGKPPSELAPEDMLHVKGLGFDGLVGYSVIQMFARTIGSGLAAEKFSSKLWANGGRPSGTLTHPGKLTDGAKDGLRKQWQRTYGGPENAGLVAILEEGLKYEALAIPPEDAQFIEQRQFNVVEICRIFGVPPHEVAELTRSTFNNIEQQEIEFVRDTLTPWACRLEEEADVKLLGPSRVRRYFTRLDFRERLRGDTKARAEYARTMVQGSMMSPNEGREAEDLNPVDGGDELLAQVNMTTLQAVVDGATKPEMQQQPPAVPEQTPETPENPPESGDTSDSMGLAVAVINQWAGDVALRVIRREVNRINDLSRGDKTPHKLNEQVTGFYLSHPDWMLSQFSPIVEAIRRRPAEVPDLDASVMRELRSQAWGDSVTNFETLEESSMVSVAERLRDLFLVSLGDSWRN